MSPKPGGRIFGTDAGADLTLERRFNAPIEDVWQSLTDPDSTARWFGRWEGRGAVGETVVLCMEFEEGKPSTRVTIRACHPPQRLEITTKDDYGEWHMTLILACAGGVTTLTFVQHMSDARGVGEIGPGWEYYLDMLVAARLGGPQPQFDAYYPAQKQYYLDALARL